MELLENPKGIECSNCCCSILDNPPIYELFEGESVAKVSSMLEKIYRFTHLRNLDKSDDPLIEEAPLCTNCARILSQIDILYEEFDRIRGIDSYLSRKIIEIDEVISEGIAGLKNKRLPESERQMTTGSNTAIKVKVEPVEHQEPSNVLLPSSGPWVVLKRLKAEEIPGKKSNFNSEVGTDDGIFDDDGHDDSPEVDFEMIFSEGGNEDVDLNVSEHDEEKFSCKDSKKDSTGTPKRASKRLRVKPTKCTQRRESNVGKAIEPKKRAYSKTGKYSTQKIVKGKDGKEIKVKMKNPPKNPPNRKPKCLRLEAFLERKKAHQFPCFYCLTDFDLENDRVEHLKEVHCNKYQTAVCPPCGKIFKSEYTMKYHRCGYIPPHFFKPPVNCEECGKEFKSNWHLQFHKSQVHVDRLFSCNECTHKAKTAASLSIHKKYAHGEAAPVECPECHTVLKSQATFECHYRKMHTEKGYASYIKVQKRLQAKKREKRRQNAVTTSFCFECNIDFQSIGRHILHRNEVHATNKKWQCEQCGKGFNKAWVFQNHIRYVHSEERPFICDKCGISFKSPNNLQTHTDRVHTDKGRQKYNEYNRENYKLKRKLAEELSKAKQTQETPSEEVLNNYSSSLPVPGTSTADFTSILNLSFQ